MVATGKGIKSNGTIEKVSFLMEDPSEFWDGYGFSRKTGQWHENVENGDIASLLDSRNGSGTFVELAKTVYKFNFYQ